MDCRIIYSFPAVILQSMTSKLGLITVTGVIFTICRNVRVNYFQADRAKTWRFNNHSTHQAQKSSSPILCYCEGTFTPISLISLPRGCERNAKWQKFGWYLKWVDVTQIMFWMCQIWPFLYGICDDLISLTLREHLTIYHLASFTDVLFF